MQINSYTFQTPYPQPVQVGRLDPASTQADEQKENRAIQESQKAALSIGKVNPTMDTGVTISLSALESGNSQSGVSEFKSLVNINQGKKAYSQE